MPLPLPHQQLLGTWISDRRRTFQHWKPCPHATAAGIRKFKALFGKLTLRWTPKRCYSRFNESEPYNIEPYEVVAHDDHSLVVRVAQRELLGGGDILYHIHLEGDRYWMALGNFPGFVEWFKRVK